MSVLALINLRLIDLIKNNNELWPELTRVDVMHGACTSIEKHSQINYLFEKI
jgi:hypothetical protein